MAHHAGGQVVTQHRTMRSAAASLPSQTMTTPVLGEAHPYAAAMVQKPVAPLAVFSGAFGNDQSDTASEPSCIASVSRLGAGNGTESKVIAAVTAPAPTARRCRTISLNAGPDGRAALVPTQQMRAGSLEADALSGHIQPVVEVFVVGSAL